MIKFFRKIRQKLLANNKLTKYLLYAIGEIVLVVIGILIALQINNRNEYHKDRALERELLNQLRSEFNSNLNQLNDKIALRNDMITASFKLLDYIDHPEKRNRDSIIRNIAMTKLAPTFDPIVNDLTSSGRIQLLENSTLKEKLSLWTSEIIQVTEEEDVWLFFRSHGYEPFLIEKGINRTLINQFWQDNTLRTFHLDKGFESDFNLGNSNTDFDISDILDDSRFEGYVAQCASFNELTNSQSISLRNRIVEIINLIDMELNR